MHFSVIAFVIACLLVAGCARAESGKPLKRHPLAHVVQITASLTFDGKPVRIDDLIDCHAGYTGTPTSSPYMVFRQNRHRITHEVPGGGMISFGVSRELCYVNRDQWGRGGASYSAPAAWTPVLEWYDHRDVMQRREGIIYLSETALTDPNGRLRITEPFTVRTPEHPASPALLAEAARQAVDRDHFQGRKLRGGEKFRLARQPMEWMVRIPESHWRDPRGAFPEQEFRFKGKRAVEDHDALAKALDAYGGSGPIALGSPASVLGEDARGVLSGLRRAGIQLDLNQIYTFGIPRLAADRFGMLAKSEAIERKKRSSPYFPSRPDTLVPLKCISGVVTPAPETPGVRYWYRDRCSHPKFYKGHSFFGRQLTGPSPLGWAKLVFDRSSGDLWWII